MKIVFPISGVIRGMTEYLSDTKNMTSTRELKKMDQRNKKMLNFGGHNGEISYGKAPINCIPRSKADHPKIPVSVSSGKLIILLKSSRANPKDSEESARVMSSVCKESSVSSVELEWILI